MERERSSEEQAWFDGYKAAAEAAASVQVRIGHEEADEALNHGIQLVAHLLRSQLEKMS